MIDEKGTQHGVLEISQALNLAKSFELDLVLVAPEAKPPVCKIIDYGKYRYQLNKKEKKAHTKAGIIKELKLTPKISENDYQVRVRHAKEFLEKGYKVSVSVFFRGREMTHQEIGLRHLTRFAEEVASVGTVEKKPVLFGHNLGMLISPITGGKKKNAQN